MMNNRKSRFILIFTFLVFLQAGLSFPTHISANALSIELLQATKGLDPDMRYEAYMEMIMNTSNWEVGMIVSESPFAVITDNDEDVYKLKVFTGVLNRNADDLLVDWDDIWVKPDGELRLAAVGITEKIHLYFAQNDQDAFHNIRYAGIMPGIDIPTDLEAKVRRVSPVPSDGAINYYQIDEIDKTMHMTTSQHPIKEGKPYSDEVPLAIYPHIEVKLPADIQSHWAKAYTLDLMSKQIIKGYPDGQIKPANKLTRAEFIALLIQSLGLRVDETNLSGQTNWFDPVIATANSFGIVTDEEMLVLQPNEYISRIEMVLYLERAILIYDDQDRTSSILPYLDVKALSPLELHALQTVHVYGVIGGYADGTFKPASTLSRAEAFVVISKLIQELS